jgi:preprotein translocase subunit SecA
MTPNEIFEALATAGPGRFPREALIEAAEQREAMTPLLLDELRHQVDAGFAPAMAEQLANPMPYEPLGLTGLPGHPVEELAHWAAFRSEKPTARRASAPALPRGIPAPTHQPWVRAGPKVGRNDPCPCGSGRKYKKCCGA